jgi:uncharacterized membrane protein YpjA
MSLGGKKNPNSCFDLMRTLFIGIACLILGLWAIIDRFFFGFTDGLIDVGKYHRIIGLGLIAVSLIYLYLVIRNYLKET